MTVGASDEYSSVPFWSWTCHRYVLIRGLFEKFVSVSFFVSLQRRYSGSRLVYNEAGCVDSASVRIKIYQSDPVVFVPTAFTPNGDGRNDILRPLAAGITTIEYFRIYNRWGQMVFSTSTNGKGWDGRIQGREQSTASFVWEVKATDYKGQPFVQKGTVTLIR